MGLVLQAVYPFLLCGGAVRGPIKLDIIEGTNVQKPPLVEYISQVFAPNLKVLGFPELIVELLERGWTVGSRNPGKVRCLINPLPSIERRIDFPPLNLNKNRRGKVTKIDITVIAPDTETRWPGNCPLGPEEVLSLRKYIEHETIAKLREELDHVPSHMMMKMSP